MNHTSRVSTSSLKLGMYVAELDRPWLGTPFMFQGFRIESEDDIRRLREYCKEVVVDTSLSGAEPEEQTIRLGVPGTAGQPPSMTPRPAERKIGALPPRDDVRSRIARAGELKQRARRFIAGVFQDVRLGAGVDTAAANALVGEMVETIADDADTLMWMTRLKAQHEYTLQHCMNVCALALAFGHHLGFANEHLKVLGLGALLHDIGKVNTPVGILDKPGKLTPEEFEIIKRHPVDGYEIVRASGDVPDGALQVIKYHHERISGRGYPEGLRGNEISTAVLVVAIADVYDALTSDRAYHHGIQAHESLTLMHHLAPNDFGKELMTEFIRCIGIYPVGSLVELGNGALGIVIKNFPANRLRPLVVMVRDPSGQPYPPGYQVSLAAQSDPALWTVRRVVDPKNYGIDFQAVLARELVSRGESIAAQPVLERRA